MVSTGKYSLSFLIVYGVEDGTSLEGFPPLFRKISKNLVSFRLTLRCLITEETTQEPKGELSTNDTKESNVHVNHLIPKFHTPNNNNNRNYIDTEYGIIKT